METDSWPGTISIKIPLAKIAFLPCSILLCYLLNMSSFCIGSISWCYFVVPNSGVLLFRFSYDIPIVPPVFRSCASIPAFDRCSEFRCSVFRCSWFYSMPRATRFESLQFKSENFINQLTTYVVILILLTLSCILVRLELLTREVVEAVKLTV